MSCPPARLPTPSLPVRPRPYAQPLTPAPPLLLSNRWIELTSPQAFPLRTIGLLSSPSAGCTGQVIGRYTLGSAAHCVYDRASRAFMTNYDFLPSAYVSGGSVQARKGCWREKGREAPNPPRPPRPPRCPRRPPPTPQASRSVPATRGRWAAQKQG